MAARLNPLNLEVAQAERRPPRSGRATDRERRCAWPPVWNCSITGLKTPAHPAPPAQVQSPWPPVWSRYIAPAVRHSPRSGRATASERRAIKLPWAGGAGTLVAEQRYASL